MDCFWAAEISAGCPGDGVALSKLAQSNYSVPGFLGDAARQETRDCSGECFFLAPENPAVCYYSFSMIKVWAFNKKH